MKRTWIHTITVFALVVLWMPALVMFPEPQAHAAERHAKPPIPNILGKYIGIFHSDVNGTGGLMEFNIPALKKIGQFTGTLNFNGENSLRLKGRFLTKRLFSAIASKRGMVVRMKGQSSLDGETITGTYISRAGRNRDKGAFSISRYHANVVGGYIGPDGGKITTEDGASLIVPPGVFDEYSLVTVQSVSEDDLPQSPPVDSALLGGIEIESNITNLNGSAIITVPLNTPLTPGTPVPLFIFDPLQNEYVFEAEGLVNEEGNSVITQVDHFSIRAIFQRTYNEAEQKRRKDDLVSQISQFLSRDQGLCSYKNDFFKLGDINKVKDRIYDDDIQIYVDPDYLDSSKDKPTASYVNLSTQYFNDIILRDEPSNFDPNDSTLLHETMHAIFDEHKLELLLVGIIPVHSDFLNDEKITTYFEYAQSVIDARLQGVEQYLQEGNCDSVNKMLNTFVKILENPLSVRQMALVQELTGFYVDPSEIKILYETGICGNCNFGTDAWSATYGGGGYEWANSIQQTSDGGYIVAGETSSFGAGDADIWLLKLDASGNVQWQKTYGGSNDDRANSIQQTSDGGYIVAGGTYSFGGVWVLKLDSSGNVQWQKAYGGCGSDLASSIQQTGDGGYIVAGKTQDPFCGGVSNLWVLKLDSSGNVQWQKTYNESADEIANSIQQTNDGGYIVAGWTGSLSLGSPHAGSVLWVLKLSSDGTVEWQKKYGRGSFFDVASSIQQTNDGGYIVAGGHSKGEGPEAFWVLKLNANGTILWQKTYGWGHPYSIQQTSDSGYIVAGWNWDNGVMTKVLKLDSNGDIEWQKGYGMYVEDKAHAIQQTSDGGYIVAGWNWTGGTGFFPDFLVSKLKPDGTINPSCGFRDTNVSGIDSNATVQDTNAIVSDTNVTPQDSSATVQDTNVSANFLCQSQ